MIAQFPDFNPHSREGSDRLAREIMRQMEISIHTPAKGVTCQESKRYGKYAISIHTPAKGVTELVPVYETSTGISIHTPAKGVTSLFY